MGKFKFFNKSKERDNSNGTQAPKQPIEQEANKADFTPIEEMSLYEKVSDELSYSANWLSNKFYKYYPDYFKSAQTSTEEERKILAQQDLLQRKNRVRRDAVVRREIEIQKDYNNDLGYIKLKNQIVKNWYEIEAQQLSMKKQIDLGLVPPLDLDPNLYSTVPGWIPKEYERDHANQKLCQSLQCSKPMSPIDVELSAEKSFVEQLESRQVYSQVEKCSTELQTVRENLESCVAFVNDPNNNLLVQSTSSNKVEVTSFEKPEVIQVESQKTDNVPILDNITIVDNTAFDFLLSIPIKILNADFQIRNKKSKILTKIMIPVVKVMAIILVLTVYHQVLSIIFNVVRQVLDSVTASILSYLPRKTDKYKDDELNIKHRHHDPVELWKKKISPMADFMLGALGTRGGFISVSDLHPIKDRELILSLFTPEICLIKIEKNLNELRDLIQAETEADIKVDQNGKSFFKLIKEKKDNLINNPQLKASFIGLIVFLNSNILSISSFNTRSMELKHQETFSAIEVEENMKEHVELGNAVKTADFNSANKTIEPVKIAKINQKNRIKKLKKPFKQVTLTEFLEKNPTTDSEKIIEISKISSVNSRIQIRIPQ